MASCPSLNCSCEYKIIIYFTIIILIHFFGIHFAPLRPAYRSTWQIFPSLNSFSPCIYCLLTFASICLWLGRLCFSSFRCKGINNQPTRKMMFGMLLCCAAEQEKKKRKLKKKSIEHQSEMMPNALILDFEVYSIFLRMNVKTDKFILKSLQMKM